MANKYTYMHVCIHTYMYIHVQGTRMCTNAHVCAYWYTSTDMLHVAFETHTGWTTTPAHISVEPCTIPVGPLVPTSRDALEMFSHFFSDDVLSLIVTETNRFAAQCLAASHTPATWETNLNEVKAYLGFMIVMGINKLPEIRDYWSVDTKLNNAYISSRITRKRFEEISRYIHFVDNTTLPLRDEPGFHRLQKVMPIITALKEKFEGNYHPHPQNSVDEAMIPFKGLYVILYMYYMAQTSEVILCQTYRSIHVPTLPSVHNQRQCSVL